MSRLYHSIIEHTNQYSYTSSIFTKVMHIMAAYYFVLSTCVRQLESEPFASLKVNHLR